MKPVLILSLSGEVFIKSEWTRKFFEKKLTENISSVLRKKEISFEKISMGRGKMFLYASESELKKGIPFLQNVFGLNELSLAFQENADDFDSVIQKSLDFFRQSIRKNKSFAIQTSRTGNHSFKSIDINKKLGKLIQKEFSLPVSLDNPEQTLSLEIINKKLFLIKESFPCVQGFPIGTAPSTALLLSGTENDLLAGFLMLSKGSRVFPVFNEKTKIPKNHLTPLLKFNNFNDFTLTSFSELKTLAKKEGISSVVLPDSKKFNEENFFQGLLVIKPLDFLPEKKLKCLMETVFSPEKQS